MQLRLWLAEYAQGPQAELILPQPPVREGALPTRFWLPPGLPCREVTANLIEIGAKFRLAVGHAGRGGVPLGKEYLLMVRDGVMVPSTSALAGPTRGRRELLAPAYTFLMSQSPGAVPILAGCGQRRAGSSACTSRSPIPMCSAELAALGNLDGRARIPNQPGGHAPRALGLTRRWPRGDLPGTERAGRTGLRE